MGRGYQAQPSRPLRKVVAILALVSVVRDKHRQVSQRHGLCKCPCAWTHNSGSIHTSVSHVDASCRVVPSVVVVILRARDDV